MAERILVIDDERNIRLTLASCLEGAGYEVVSAVNGEDGLEKFRNDRFDLVFLDMKLPGMDGIETLARIKEHSKTAAVVMMTAYGTVQTAVEAMKLGAVDYICKPFSPEGVRRVAATVMARRKLERDNVQSFEDMLEFAKDCITRVDFDSAHAMLQKAVAANTTKPEPFNLLGVILELKGRTPDAQKMYRAALALDPTYAPAAENLHRTVQLDYSRGGINLGDSEADHRRGSGHSGGSEDGR